MLIDKQKEKEWRNTLRKIPYSNNLVFESGPIQFGDNWPGLYLRGLDSYHFGTYLRQLLDEVEIHPIQKSVLGGLVDYLLSIEAKNFTITENYITKKEQLLYITKRDEILELIRNNCLQFGDFTLSSGMHSRVLINLKQITTKNIPETKEFLEWYVIQVNNIVKSLDGKHDFVGPPTGANPLIDKCKRHLPFIQGSNTVVVLDDVLTTGGSIIQEIEKHQYQVLKIISVVDREKHNLYDKYDIDSLFTLTEVLHR